MRIFSRGVMLALCAMLGFAAMTMPADAVFRKLAFVSKTTVASACGAAGATPIGDGVTTYGCIKSNCDGKGGECAVECNTDKKTCTGSSPSRIADQTTLVGILQNGDTVVRGGQPPALGSVLGSRGAQPASDDEVPSIE